MKAVIYARVSSREQEREGYSIPAQRKLLGEYAKTRGFSVIREFIDVESAKNPGRKEFGSMLDLLRNGAGCRVVLVEKTDRLYRNRTDSLTFEELIENNGVEIHLVKEGARNFEELPLARQVHARHPRRRREKLQREPERGSQEGDAGKSRTGHVSRSGTLRVPKQYRYPQHRG